MEVKKTKVPNHIPKRLKSTFVFRGRIVFPTNNTATLYEGQSYFSKASTLYSYGLFRDKNDKKSVLSSKKGHDNMSLLELQRRYEQWKRFINFDPEVKCIPTETYLMVAVTSTGSDDTLSPPQRYKEVEILMKDKDFSDYLNIKKIIMIPRPLNHQYMYYCISNLHKWVHGTLHMCTLQETCFKDATSHIPDIVYLDSGRSFSDKDLGIEIRYKDQLPFSQPILRDLIPYVANAMDSSTTSIRPIPCLSLGWTLTNPMNTRKTG
jgi:hypothetical protein